jgi:WXG100 family type VII secretion target
MAAPKVRGDYDQLKQIQQQFSQQAEKIQAMTNDLKSKMDTLQGGDWIGEGANQFYQEMESQVIPHMNKLHNALTEAASTSGKISQAIQDLEQKTSKQFVWRLA